MVDLPDPVSPADEEKIAALLEVNLRFFAVRAKGLHRQKKSVSCVFLLHGVHDLRQQRLFLGGSAAHPQIADTARRGESVSVRSCRAASSTVSFSSRRSSSRFGYLSRSSSRRPTHLRRLRAYHADGHEILARAGTAALPASRAASAPDGRGAAAKTVVCTSPFAPISTIKIALLLIFLAEGVGHRRAAVTQRFTADFPSGLWMCPSAA